MAGKEKPLFLVCPLDWGLGHTTRMIPVISHLLELGCGVIVACNSIQRELLQMEFPLLRFVDLEGYNLRYGRNMTTTRVKLLLSLPNILIKVKKEQVWFLRFLKQNRVDAVISDNRYGLGRAGIPAILVTHQLRIRSGFGSIADAITGRLVYKYIHSFSECWVPDYEGKANLAGELSHPQKLPLTPVRYLGCLSRFTPCSQTTILLDILIILSGPEPQRTVLELKIARELRHTPAGKVALVRGLPGSTDILSIPGVSIFNHADAKKLNELMCAAELIISRSGYTTVMDGVSLKKKMVVVATPGQAEQEYLARHLSENNIAASLPQREFSIASAIQQSQSFKYKIPSADMNQYKQVIDTFIASRFSL